MQRSRMVVDRLYLEESSGQYAVTPDTIGVYWYDTAEDAYEQHGRQKVYSVNEIED